MDYLKAAIIAGVTFITLDGLWIYFVAQSLYRRYLGALMRPQPQWVVAGLAYVLMVAGFIWFVYPQVQMTRSVLQAMQYGARFGIVLFGAYELTNYAILANWPITLMVIDTLWGAFLYAAASVAVFYIRNIW